MVSKAKRQRVHDTMDYMLAARKVARWSICEKFASHIYHSSLSDLELDDFITSVYAQLGKK